MSSKTIRCAKTTWKPNDYEYEPTPHDAVLEKSKQARAIEGTTMIRRFAHGPRNGK